MTRRRHRKEISHERWLVSYADFITLLFAFFVVMFASSHADRNKAKRASDAVAAAFDGAKKPSAPRATPAAHAFAPDGLEPTLNHLAKDLGSEIRAGKMQLRMESRGLVVSLSQKAFFPSGEDALDPSSFGSLEKVALEIRDLPNSIRSEGHTDSLPIHNPRFRSNWDLSAARAIAVMELFRDRFQIPPDRMAVTGYADTIPLESNSSEAGRARNRRVDIVILNGASELREKPAPSRPAV